MSPPIPRLRCRLFFFALALIALLGLTLAWRWSPLRDWLEPEHVIDGLRLLGQRMGPLSAILGLGVALSLAVPLILLTLVSVVAFGPWMGSLCIFVGAVSSAAVSHGIGKLLGHELLVRLGGTRVNLLSQSIARRGLVAVIALRLVPVAPFAIVNMVAGATHLRLRHMFLGTAVGMCPGTLAVALFADQLMLSIKQPGPGRYAVLALTAALIILGIWGLRRWMRSQQLGLDAPDEPSHRG